MAFKVTQLDRRGDEADEFTCDTKQAAVDWIAAEYGSLPNCTFKLMEVTEILVTIESVGDAAQDAVAITNGVRISA